MWNKYIYKPVAVVTSFKKRKKKLFVFDVSFLCRKKNFVPPPSLGCKIAWQLTKVALTRNFSFAVVSCLCIHLWYVPLKVKLNHYTPWRHWSERRYSSYSFLTLALDVGRAGGQHHASVTLSSLGKDFEYHLLGRWVGPRVGLDAEGRRKILFSSQGLNPDHAVCNQKWNLLNWGMYYCSYKE